MKAKTRNRIRLTEKQKQARETVDTFKEANGYPPSYRELMALLNLKSTSAVYYRLRGYRHKMIKQESK